MEKQETANDLPDIEQQIESEHYFSEPRAFPGVGEGCATFCILLLKNGHRVVGEAGSAQLETEPQRDWARKIAKESAVLSAKRLCYLLSFAQRHPASELEKLNP